MKAILANEKDIPTLQKLAKKIWKETYTQILSHEQIQYMLEQMYSYDEIYHHLQSPAWKYYLLTDDHHKYLGFIGFEKNYEKDTTKLHRIYLLAQSKGMGLGTFAIEQMIKSINKENSRIILNVNKYNSARGFYEKLGFKIYGEGVFDIGNGYVMDDYLMELILPKP